jgi:hypothetical protein
MHEVDIWRADKFVERARPLEISSHRRPVANPDHLPVEVSPQKPASSSDWLGNLVDKAREQPEPHVETPEELRTAKNQALFDLLACRLDPSSFDQAAARDLLDRFGPFDLEQSTTILDDLFSANIGRDLHVGYYIDTIRNAIRNLTHE